MKPKFFETTGVDGPYLAAMAYIPSMLWWLGFRLSALAVLVFLAGAPGLMFACALLAHNRKSGGV
jgi:hypothetical protein